MRRLFTAVVAMVFASILPVLSYSGPSHLSDNNSNVISKPNSGANSRPQAAPASDPSAEAALDSHFNPLQDNPQYFGDRKCKKPLPIDKARTLIKYKPNFGEKIWVKSHLAKDIEDKASLLGALVAERTYTMTALEIADHVAPHLQKHLEGTGINYQEWADTFEKWGRTYVDDSQGGSKPSTFIVKDFQNGNFLVLKPKSGKSVCYYIAERYDAIIKGMLSYAPQNSGAGK